MTARGSAREFDALNLIELHPDRPQLIGPRDRAVPGVDGVGELVPVEERHHSISARVAVARVEPNSAHQFHVDLLAGLEFTDVGAARKPDRSCGATHRRCRPARATAAQVRRACAQVDFTVSREDCRFEIDVDIDDAKPSRMWRVVIEHDGKRIHNRVHRANGEGDVDIEKIRRNTNGADVFKVRVKRVGGGDRSRTIRMR